MKQLSGKLAVITGGASGIGLALARRFGAEGCRVLLADIEDEPLRAAVAALGQEGIEADGCRTDVADPASVGALAAHARERFGNVHLLFNNAGVSITGPTWMFSSHDWRWVWGVNVWGVVNGIQAFLPGMLAHGEEAHIINTGSLASFMGNGDHAPYCSSKAAVLAISQSLYSEMRALTTKVGVSIVCPGMVATRIHQSWRNRPGGDVPWSERESADPAFRANADAFQGAGIPPEAIADAACDAVRQDRFYVFAGPSWPNFMEAALGRAMRGENPVVMTWGQDRRPAQERELPPWAGSI